MLDTVLQPEIASERKMARKLYRVMLEARLLESKLSSLYKAGQIVGGVYLGKGHEALSGSVGCNLIKGTDFFAPLIRDQAGRTGFGEDILDCTRTYLGSIEGPMKGRDGNIHRGRPAEGMYAMISHLGASVALVCGALMARRIQGKLDGVVGAAILGEGATSTGAFHEAINLAAVERLSLVTVIGNNQFAYSTPNDKQFACENLLDRARGYGVEGHELDGTDFLQCLRVMGKVVQRARSGHGPQLVVARLLRLSGHGEHDDASYISEETRKAHYGRDCMVVGRQQMIEEGYATQEEIDEWKNEFQEKIQAALTKAQREPKPDPWAEQWQAVSQPLI